MKIKDFIPGQTFDCGQCFRWSEEPDGSWTGIVMNNIVNMRFEDGKLTCCIINKSSSAEPEYTDEIPEWLSNYLDLGTDYGSIKSLLSQKDKVIEKCIPYGEGIRILRQDLWETIVSFIISQNNNIPRIKKCIDSLAELAGECVGTYDGPDGSHPGKKYYALPTAEKLAGMSTEDLGPIHLGYRDKYLIETAGQVAGAGVPDDLTELQGVGPKVANCIDLFGRHNMAAFPIDVWVKRVMNRLYGFDENDVRGMADFAKEKFGEYGGIVQQYLFHYVRTASSEK